MNKIHATDKLDFLCIHLTLQKPDTTFTTKNGVQHSRKTPIIMPIVTAALCSCNNWGLLLFLDPGAIMVD